MGTSPLGRGFQEVYGFLLRMVGSKRNSLRETFFFCLEFRHPIQKWNSHFVAMRMEDTSQAKKRPGPLNCHSGLGPFHSAFSPVSFLPFFPISSGILYFWGSNLAQNECSVEFLAFEPVVAVV